MFVVEHINLSKKLKHSSPLPVRSQYESRQDFMIRLDLPDASSRLRRFPYQWLRFVVSSLGGHVYELILFNDVSG
jgi:hypothetical protein